MINIEEARLSYFSRTGVCKAVLQAPFTEYSHAYVTSNEHLPYVMDELQPVGKSVLTVAGSGDQPIFFKLYGATDVDSFDISYCAKALMDIKTAAIQSVPRAAYVNFLQKLFKYSDKMQDLYVYQESKNLCSDEVKNFIAGMAGCKICRQGYMYFDNVPSNDEYERLRPLLEKPFNFIWSDLYSLSAKLNRTYDIIYLSNILQYNCDYDFVSEVLNGLLPYLNKGGKIMLHISPWFNYKEYELFCRLRDAMKRRIDIKRIKHKEFEMCVARKL